MNETDFFYWLQGYFEITATDGPPLISKARADVVKRHIALARASLRRGQQLGERVARIELLLDMVLDGADVDTTRRIRVEVDAQFEHVIDPLAGDAEQQAKLNAIHGPSVSVRC